MKKVVFCLVLFLLLFSGQALAQSHISIVINGQHQTFEQPPIVMDGRTMVPIRFVSESLGGEVLWDEATKEVTVLRGERVVQFGINQYEARVNNQPVSLDVPATIINGRTMVPVRFVSELLGMTVGWNESTKTVTINDNKELNDGEIVNKVRPAVVKIETNRGSASGFYVNDSGKLVTNAHAVRGASQIHIIDNEGDQYTATIVSIDNWMDLAILQLDKNIKTPFIKLSSNQPAIGDKIFAFGTPLGVFQSIFTEGNIIDKGLSPDESWNPRINVYIHNASTSPGSSGGPIVNKSGELVGIHFAGISFNPSYATNYNFAVPTNYYVDLDSREDGYSLRDDYLGYYTEENSSWKPVLDNIANFFSGRTITYRDAYTMNNEILPALEGVIQQVNSYQPYYDEILELRKLYLNKLQVDKAYFNMYASYLANPSIDYNTHLYELWEITQIAMDKYVEKHRELYERLN